jgi:VWFA-related protein
MNTRSVRWLGILLLILGVFTPAHSQTSPPAKDQTPLVLHSSTQLVQMNVIALDSRRHPVTTLKASDFVLTDDGKPQRISVFFMDQSGKSAGPAPTLPPNVFTNRREYHPDAASSVTLILLDTINTAFEDQAFARSQIQKFLTRMRPNELVSIYVLGANLRMLHDFSNDAASLSRSLAEFRGELPNQIQSSASTLEPPANGNIDPTNGQGQRDRMSSIGTQAPTSWDVMQYDAMEGEYSFMVHRRANKTVESFGAIANYLARIPGRKNLIWISDGFPFALGFETLRISPTRSAQMPEVLWREIEHGTRALNNANLAIYPIDARGLLGLSMYSSSERLVDFTTGHLTQGMNEQDTMQELADLTGGRAFYNTNGLTEAIQEALDDSRVSYTLGFYPTHGNWVGRFHKVKIMTSRPGVRLRYRLGYLALPEVAPTAADLKANFEAAEYGPLDANGLSLTAEVTLAGNSMSIKVHVDPNGITLKPQGGLWQGSLEFLADQFDSSGHDERGKPSTMYMNLKQATFNRIEREGVSFTCPVDILPGTQRIRVVARDVLSGAIGSVTIQVKHTSTHPGK